jgi:hypothetical protein
LFGSLIFAWMVIPTVVSPSDALDLAINNFYPNSIVQDTNMNYLFVSGLDATPINVKQQWNAM